MSSSSAIDSRSRARAFTRDPQPFLDRVAVDAAVLEVELVRPLGHLMHGVAWHQPQRDRLAAATVLLARPRVGERRIRGVDRAGMGERLTFPLLTKDLEDHATRTASRTHFSCSRKRARNASRSCERGPWPVTTDFSSSQSGSPYSHTPSSRRRRSGSGSVRPSSHTCGTYPSRNCCRASSFPCDLIRQTYIGSSSRGIGLPWNCIKGPHHRSSASCTSSRCSSVPVIIARITSRP